MLHVALTGNVAAGKSAVARLFARMVPDGPVWSMVRQARCRLSR